MFILIGIGFIVLAIIAAWIGYSEDITWLKVACYVCAVLGIASIVLWTTTAQGQREIKSWSSNTSGGLIRTVEVYDQSGKLIKTYEGKLDVQENDFGNKVLFDLDGKRTVIYNATVIVQEK